MGNKKFVWVSKNSHKKCLWNENEKEILLPMLCNTFIPTQNNQIVFVWNWVILESRRKNWQLPDIAWRFREMKFSWVQRFHFIYSTQLQEITCLDSKKLGPSNYELALKKVEQSLGFFGFEFLPWGYIENLYQSISLKLGNHLWKQKGW